MRDASSSLHPSIQNCMRALGVSYCSHIGNQVYLVDSPLYGKVALKFALSKLAKSQLHNEANFLGNYASSYWPSFIDADSHNQTSWLMYGFVEGQSQADCKAQSNSALISKLETGLRTIHETGFIHGDIKPANILTSPNGEPVFVDLGSVLPIGRRYSEQAHSSVTPSFACVSALKRHGLIRIQDDYTSLALTLQAMSGKHPYHGQSIAEFVATEKLPKLGALPSRYQMLLDQQLRIAKQLAARKSTG
ncbi:hypothetical protein ZX61_07185 [Vibrio sp. VPAP30]|nr:hypothetical protein ZX61_07185 [Vibrio sp. VPAP30]